MHWLSTTNDYVAEGLREPSYDLEVVAEIQLAGDTASFLGRPEWQGSDHRYPTPTSDPPRPPPT